MVVISSVDAFMNAAVDAYLECALWTEHVEYVVSRWDTSTLTDVRQLISEFIADNIDDVVGMDAGQMGHDLWLTQNGHGAGFWDRGLGEVGERLTDAAKAYGSADVYLLRVAGDGTAVLAIQ